LPITSRLNHSALCNSVAEANFDATVSFVFDHLAHDSPEHGRKPLLSHVRQHLVSELAT